MFVQRILLSALVVGCGAIPASATLVDYTTAAAFTAATATDTFQNITFPTGSDGTTYTDATTSVIFSDSGGISSLIGITTPAGYPAGSSLKATNCSTPGSCVTTLTITLPSAVTAVSMDLGLTGFNAFQVTASNGVDASFSSNQEQGSLSTPIFYGLVSSSPFTTLTIATEDPVNSLLLDNIQIGTMTGSGGSGGGGDPPDTPEVATLIMIGSGLIMLRCGRRWMPRAS